MWIDLSAYYEWVLAGAVLLGVLMGFWWTHGIYYKSPFERLGK